MAVIGKELTDIFEKNTITTYIIGFLYGIGATIAPMLIIISVLLFTWRFIGFSSAPYAEQDLFSCTILYIFIFALLATSVLNAVISRYMSDVIYEENFDDILPCFYTGLLITLIIGCLPAIPFCFHEHFVGGVPIYYVFTGFIGFVGLILAFYSMEYLSITKDYKKISLYFIIGMVYAFLSTLFLVKRMGVGAGYAMLFSMSTGFLLTGCLEAATVKQYFKENSRNYKGLVTYCRTCWKLIAANFLYTLGLYVHNFVFWTSDLRIVIVKSFVCAPIYDLTTCIALFTNISATVIFILRVEMFFHDRYKAYSEAVIGGRGVDIRNAKLRMFRQLSSELMSLVRIQFIISVIIYLIFVIFLPMFGLSGLVMQIYSCMAAGYFIIYIMYSLNIYLFYMDDFTGSMCTMLVFLTATLIASIIAKRLSPSWYGLGITIGSFAGWTANYFRLRWLEHNMDYHIFCKGTIIGQGKGKRPENVIYNTPDTKEEQNG